MNKIGFTKSKSDAVVFYRHNGKGFAIIAIAVDDLTMTASNDDIIRKIKADLMKIFKMKDLGELHCYYISRSNEIEPLGRLAYDSEKIFL